jgi:hypothetical protein
MSLFSGESSCWEPEYTIINTPSRRPKSRVIEFPQSMRSESVTTEILCKLCVCVSGTRSAPNWKPTNNQASTEYHTNSKVGIPILRSQMDDIINIGHSHQSYTLDPCH